MVCIAHTRRHARTHARIPSACRYRRESRGPGPCFQAAGRERLAMGRALVSKDSGREYLASPREGGQEACSRATERLKDRGSPRKRGGGLPAAMPGAATGGRHGAGPGLPRPPLRQRGAATTGGQRRAAPAPPAAAPLLGLQCWAAPPEGSTEPPSPSPSPSGGAQAGLSAALLWPRRALRPEDAGGPAAGAALPAWGWGWGWGWVLEPGDSDAEQSRRRAALPARSRRGSKAHTSACRTQGVSRDRQTAWRFPTLLRGEPDSGDTSS